MITKDEEKKLRRLVVAAAFDKRHANLLRAIESPEYSNAFITVVEILEGNLPKDFDINKELDLFVEEVKLDRDIYALTLHEAEYFEDEAFNICSIYTYCQDFWFSEYMVKKYKLVLDVSCFSITDDELLFQDILGNNNNEVM